MEGSIKFENGVTMGALYDLAYEWVATPITSFVSLVSVHPFSQVWALVFTSIFNPDLS